MAAARAEDPNLPRVVKLFRELTLSAPLHPGHHQESPGAAELRPPQRIAIDVIDDQRCRVASPTENSRGARRPVLAIVARPLLEARSNLQRPFLPTWLLSKNRRTRLACGFPRSSAVAVRAPPVMPHRVIAVPTHHLESSREGFSPQPMEEFRSGSGGLPVPVVSGSVNVVDREEGFLSQPTAFALRTIGRQRQTPDAAIVIPHPSQPRTPGRF